MIPSFLVNLLKANFTIKAIENWYLKLGTKLVVDFLFFLSLVVIAITSETKFSTLSITFTWFTWLNWTFDLHLRTQSSTVVFDNLQHRCRRIYPFNSNKVIQGYKVNWSDEALKQLHWRPWSPKGLTRLADVLKASLVYKIIVSVRKLTT